MGRSPYQGLRPLYLRDSPFQHLNRNWNMSESLSRKKIAEQEDEKTMEKN